MEIAALINAFIANSAPSCMSFQEMLQIRGCNAAQIQLRHAFVLCDLGLYFTVLEYAQDSCSCEQDSLT